MNYLQLLKIVEWAEPYNNKSEGGYFAQFYPLKRHYQFPLLRLPEPDRFQGYGYQDCLK